MAKMAGVCDAFCKGCAFYEPYSGTCNYFLSTGQIRPCPAGTGCSVKRTGNKRCRWRHEGNASWKNNGNQLRTEKPLKASKPPKPPKEVYHRICKNCGTAFDTTDPRKLYCCRKCTNQARSRAQWLRRKEKKASEARA